MEVAHEPDDFDIMMGFAPAPEPEVETEVDAEEESKSKSKEGKSREKKSKHFVPQITAAEMNEFFSEDATLKTAFKSLLAIAKR